MAAVNVAMFTRHHIGQLFAFNGNAQSLTHLLKQFGAALFVGNVPRPFFFGRSAFAQVVHEASYAHGQRSLELCAHVQHHHEVHTGVNFWVVFSALWDAPQTIHFRQ